jgi:hypothetical protein
MAPTGWLRECHLAHHGLFSGCHGAPQRMGAKVRNPPKPAVGSRQQLQPDSTQSGGSPPGSAWRATVFQR